MASMSYCVIENTCGDVWECVEKFTERQDELQSEEYEMRSLNGLYKGCKEFVEEYEKYLEDKETYIKEHSQEEYDDED